MHVFTQFAGFDRGICRFRRVARENVLVTDHRTLTTQVQTDFQVNVPTVRQSFDEIKRQPVHHFTQLAAPV